MMSSVQRIDELEWMCCRLNLASEKAGRAADLKQKLRVWRQSLLAHMPLPNPGYDPDKAAQW